jgi:hypothetical protein
MLSSLVRRTLHEPAGLLIIPLEAAPRLAGAGMGELRQE